MKFDEYILLGNATEGEQALIRIAGALESGKLPDEADAETLINAVALVRSMLHDKATPQERREAFTRKLGMTKPAHRTEHHQTIGDSINGPYDSHGRAMAFWMAKARGFGHNESVRQSMQVTHASRSSVKRAIKEHPQARQSVLVSYQQAAKLYRDATGEDHPGLVYMIRALGS